LHIREQNLANKRERERERERERGIEEGEKEGEKERERVNGKRISSITIKFFDIPTLGHINHILNM